METRGPVFYNLAQDGIFVDDYNCANASFRMAFSSACAVVNIKALF